MGNPESRSSESLLAPSCQFVAGAKRAALYDLEKGQVFSLNETGRKIIEGSPDNFGFWSQLEGMGLAGGKPEAATETGEAPPAAGLARSGLFLIFCLLVFILFGIIILKG